MTDRERALKALEDGRVTLPTAIAELVYDHLATVTHSYEGAAIVDEVLKLEIQTISG